MKPVTLEQLDLTPEDMSILVSGAQKFLPPDPDTETKPTLPEVDRAEED